MSPLPMTSPGKSTSRIITILNEEVARIMTGSLGRCHSGEVLHNPTPPSILLQCVCVLYVCVCVCIPDIITMLFLGCDSQALFSLASGS